LVAGHLIGTVHATSARKKHSSEAFMSNLGRLLIVPWLVCVGMAYSSSSPAQNSRVQSDVPARTSRTSVDGKFGHYLESSTGRIDGIVLEDGTVARFPLFALAPESAFFRPGDTVHIEGDGLSSPTGPVLFNASVKQDRSAYARIDVVPMPSANHARVRLRSHRGPQRASVAEKAQGQSADPRIRANGSLFLEGTNAGTGKKAARETRWLRKARASAVTGDAGNNSQWTRAEETSGP
jgi:hypothetical protein